MAILNSKPCRFPGCREVSDQAYCPRHHKQASLDRRPSAAARGYDRRHREWRKLILARDPVCMKCLRAESTEADHIIALEDGGDWSLDNGQGLCKPCHSSKTAHEQFEGSGKTLCPGGANQNPQF